MILDYLSNPRTRVILVLMVFAVLDLMVGVANDAVNFLNSAVGSKVATRKTIYRIAAIGIMVGASLSGGMMEVARKGIFNPAMFSFYDIMIVFFSVVIADIILLDIYNSLRLPTSTTVSVIFELLGAGLAIALIHVISDNMVVNSILQYINASSTISIISGIFLSVGIAFASGWITQTIVRSVFTFKYERHIKNRGWILGGIAITSITYFLIIKGLKGAPIFPADVLKWISSNTWGTIGLLFVFRSVVLVICQRVWKINILKIVVLAGTFALAAAFAGNDLVNFIGVSVAGYQSIMLFLASGATDVTQFMMGGLASKVHTPFIFLIGAGIVMVLTLMYSKKAQAVTETEIALTKHATGQENFKPGKISRWLVKKSIRAHKKIIAIMPHAWQRSINNRFAQDHVQHYNEAPAFDLLRACVNLTLSALLISVATNMKLPLSTTYVTFMVAMGTALADGAWGRDSGVYRISGVLTIIGSWVLTAVIALCLTMIIATLLWNTGTRGVIAMMCITAYFLYRSHRPKVSDIGHSEGALASLQTLPEILHYHAEHIVPKMQPIIDGVVEGMKLDDEKILGENYRVAKKLATHTKSIKLDVHHVFMKLGDDVITTGHTYVQAIEVLRKATLSLAGLAEQCSEYTLNKHPDLITEQHEELAVLRDGSQKIIDQTISMIQEKNYDHISHYDTLVEGFIQQLDDVKNTQLNRIKSGKTGVRNTTLYIDILTERYTIVINLQKLAHYTKRM